MVSEHLSPIQAHALFDILTHHQTYAEIEALKIPGNVANFPVPPARQIPKDTSSPLLQTLLSKFMLDLPGLRDVSPNFWSNVRGLANALAETNLSESYDKGSIGIRKTLSTAIASMAEYVSRGCIGGYPKTAENADRQYDVSKPEDVIAAWDDWLQQIIYGDMLDKMFTKAAETDQLSDHEPVVQAAHEYAIVMFDFHSHDDLWAFWQHLMDS